MKQSRLLTTSAGHLCFCKMRDGGSAHHRHLPLLPLAQELPSQPLCVHLSALPLPVALPLPPCSSAATHACLPPPDLYFTVATTLECLFQLSALALPVRSEGARVECSRAALFFLSEFGAEVCEFLWILCISITIYAELRHVEVPPGQRGTRAAAADAL